MATELMHLMPYRYNNNYYYRNCFFDLADDDATEFRYSCTQNQLLDVAVFRAESAAERARRPDEFCDARQ